MTYSTRLKNQIVESINLSVRISLLVICTNGLGYRDDNNWKRVRIVSLRAKVRKLLSYRVKK